MNKTDIVVYLGFFLIIAGVIITALTPMEEIKTNCYDRYGSQIEGLKCNKTTASNELFPVASMLLVLFGFMLVTYSFIMAYEEATRRW